MSPKERLRLKANMTLDDARPAPRAPADDAEGGARRAASEGKRA